MPFRSNKKEEIFIAFAAEPAVYREGDLVTGKVCLNLQKEIKCRDFYIELIGLALVHSEPKKKKNDPHFRPKRSEIVTEQYFSNRINLKESGSIEGVLTTQPTEHTFDCRLPQELPSAFEGKYGQIRYIAKVVIERTSNKSPLITKKAFTVLSGLDLNFIPEAAPKIDISKTRSLGGCFKQGTITLQWSIDRSGSRDSRGMTHANTMLWSGFVPGEDIYVHGAIQNESTEGLTCSKVSLFQVVDYKAKKKRHLREKREVASVAKGETRSGDVTVWQDYIHIPPVPPTGLSRCKILDIAYELHFTASFHGKVEPFHAVAEVYIGTVPMSQREMRSCIAGMFNQPYNENSDQTNGDLSPSDVTIQQLVAMETQPATAPSAPSVNTLSRGEDMNGLVEPFGSPSGLSDDVIRPPPYAPPAGGGDGQGQAAVAPTAPGLNTLQRPDEPDPSGWQMTFQESCWGPVNLDDTADGDVMGDTSYNPVYTYYNTLKKK